MMEKKQKKLAKFEANLSEFENNSFNFRLAKTVDSFAEAEYIV
jgi:hypothetical protein